MGGVTIERSNAWIPDPLAVAFAGRGLKHCTPAHEVQGLEVINHWETSQGGRFKASKRLINAAVSVKLNTGGLGGFGDGDGVGGEGGGEGGEGHGGGEGGAIGVDTQVTLGLLQEAKR